MNPLEMTDGDFNRVRTRKNRKKREFALERTTGKNDWIRFLPIIILLVVWEILGRINITSRAMFPPFSDVLKEFFVLLRNRVLIVNFEASLFRVIAGFVWGSLLGILMGIVIGWNRFIDRVLSPIISILYPIPALGWLPILMLWIGINNMLPITIIFICSFFPVCYNTVCGIKNVDPNYVRVARTLGASKVKIVVRVLFPLALPNIFTGLRLESGMAWRVIIAAEMVAIPTGIGALMMRAESLIRMDIIIICLLILSVMTFLFERGFLYLERRVVKWR